MSRIPRQRDDDILGGNRRRQCVSGKPLRSGWTVKIVDEMNKRFADLPFSKAGINQHDTYRGHYGSVTGLHFHPLFGSVDFSDLFLTSSVDWTVKLWRAKVSINRSKFF